MNPFFMIYASPDIMDSGYKDFQPQLSGTWHTQLGASTGDGPIRDHGGRPVHLFVIHDFYRYRREIARKFMQNMALLHKYPHKECIKSNDSALEPI
jgi:hypothetical protein